MTCVECMNFDVNVADCVCTNNGCERRGRCCLCIRNHRSHGNLPACLRSTNPSVD